VPFAAAGSILGVTARAWGLESQLPKPVRKRTFRGCGVL